MSPRADDSRSLAEFLARHQIAEHERSGSLRKKLLGGYELPFGSRYSLSLFVFQVGAILGRARARGIDVPASVFRIRGRSSALELLDVDGPDIHRIGEQQVQVASHSLTTFWSLYKSRRFPHLGPASVEAERSKWSPMREILTFADTAAADGVALGVTAPDLVEALWARNVAIDRAHWDQAVAIGLKIPKEPIRLSVVELEDWVVSEARAYVEGRVPQSQSVSDDLTSLGAFWFFELMVHPDQGAQAPESNAEPELLLIGRDIPWLATVRQVFRVHAFDQTDTRIVNDKVVDSGSGQPYGYLLVSSPLQRTPAILPIIHRDDFWLAASVFDDPTFAEAIQQGALLVTYAPRKVLPNGFSGDPAHCLHYVLTPPGTLERYYEVRDGLHARQPATDALFGAFVYDGHVSVGVNREPQL